MQVQFPILAPLRRSLPLAVAVLTFGCASLPPARPAADGAKSANSTPPAAGKAAEKEAPPPAAKPALAVPQTSPTRGFATAPGALEPPDGKWLVDDEGRQYFATEIPRLEGEYQWVGDEHKQVRFTYGIQFDVLSYDDQKIVVKVYRPLAPGPSPGNPSLAPAAEEKIVASYQSELRAVDRLTFRPFDNGLPREGQWRHGFALADIDGDGHLDLVHGPPRKGGSKPVIFLGDGRGNWQRWSAAKFPAVPFDYGDAAVADLNGDGRPDLVLASHLRGITAMVQDGPGNFVLWSKGIEFQAGGGGESAFSSREIELVDWNHDGRPDIMALGEGPRMNMARGSGRVDPGVRGVIVYLNQGNGTWIRSGGSPETHAVFGDNLAFGDFDGDGRRDFVTGSSIVGYKSLVNLGREDGSWQTLAVDALRPGAIFGGLAVADFDHDGRDDFAVGYLSRELGVWRTGVDVMYSRPGNVWVRRALASEESQDGLYAVGRGDLDGDGAIDLVALTGAGQGWVFLGDGKGGFVREEGTEISVGESGCRGYHVELADLDGDGTDEVLAGFAGEGTTPFGSNELCLSGGALRAWKAERRPGKG
jgi:VCBS repeat protein